MQDAESGARGPIHFEVAEGAMAQAVGDTHPPVIEVRRLSAWYGDRQALDSIDLRIARRRITAIIGPSGSGKSTLLRCINRLHETLEGARVEGTVLLDGQDIYAAGVDPVQVRRKIGMVFQRPNPSEYTAFFMGGDHGGHLVEFGPTANIFAHPEKPETADYVSGRFG